MALYSDRKALKIASLPILFSIATLFVCPSQGTFLFFCAFITCYYPLLAIILFFKKLKKNQPMYENQYIQHAWFIVFLPFVLYLGGLSVFSLVNSFGLLAYHNSIRLFIFVGVCLYLTILHFLCLTRRLRWRWLVLWYFMLLVLWGIAFVDVFQTIETVKL